MTFFIPDGMVTFFIPDGRVAFFIPDGMVTFFIPDGMMTFFIPDGMVTFFIPDGMVTFFIPLTISKSVPTWIFRHSVTLVATFLWATGLYIKILSHQFSIEQNWGGKKLPFFFKTIDQKLKYLYIYCNTFFLRMLTL